MKKIFTSVALFLASCASVMAQAPTKLNYQGVYAEKNANVTVVFEIVKGEEVVYTETQEITTNKDGVFSTQIGGGENWADVDWSVEGLKLNTSINENLYSVCDFAAVPYAKMAEKYVGQEYIENDVQALTEEMRNVVKVGQYEEDKLDILRQLENANMTGAVAQAAYDQADANADAIAIVSSDLQGVQEVLRGKANVEDVAAIENLAQSLSEDLYKEGGLVDLIAKIPELENMAENAHMTGAVAQTAYDMADANADAIAIVSSDLQGVQEVLRGKANVEDVAAIENLAQSLSEDLYKEDGLVDAVVALQEATADLEATTNLAQSLSEDLYKEGGLVDAVVALQELELPNVVENLEGLVPVVETMTEDIEGLKQNVELLYSEEDGPIAALNQGFTQLSNVVMDKADAAELEATTNLAQSLSEDLYKEGGLVEAVVALQDMNLPNVLENLEGLVPVVETLTEGVTANEEAIAIVSSDVQGIQEALRGVATVEGVAELKKEFEEGFMSATNGRLTVLEDNQNLVETVREGLLEHETSILNNAEAIANVSSDVQGIQESLRGKANVDDVAAFKQDVENAMENVMKLGEYVTGEDENSVFNQLEKLNEGMDIVSSDVQGIQESLRGYAKVEEVASKADFDNVVENLEMFTPQLEVINETLDANTEAIGNVTSDVQGIQETLRGKASVEDLAEFKGSVESAMENIQKLAEYVTSEEEEGSVYNQLATLNEDVTNALQMIQNAQMEHTNYVTGEDLDETLADVNAQIKDVRDMAGNFIQSFEEDVLSPIQEAIDAVDVTSEVQGLQEAIQNKANVADVTELQNENEYLQAQVVSLSSALGNLLNALIGGGILTEEQAEAIMANPIAPLKK